MKQQEKHKKKLIYILPEYNLDVATHTYHLYEFIEEIGKEIDMFLIIEKANAEPKFQNIKEFYVINSKFSASRALKFFYAVLKARIKGYKILYTHYSYYGGILGSIIMRLTGGKSLYWSCGMMGEYKRPFSLNLSVLKDKIKREYPLWIILRIINYLITGTPIVAKHYAKEFKISLSKIKIMPNWVNTDRLNSTRFDRGKLRKRLGLQEEERVILFAHRLTPARLTTTVLPEIVSQINNRISDVKFLILGDGPIKLNIEKEIKKKFKKNVLFKGWVPNRIIPEFLVASDVFIIPSLLEGFPRVLIEAMAMGIPFVTTDAGGIPDILTEEQKEYMVPAGNWSLFAEKIVELLNSEDKRQKMITEGLQNISNYSLKRVSKIFQEEVIDIF